MVDYQLTMQLMYMQEIVNFKEHMHQVVTMHQHQKVLQLDQQLHYLVQTLYLINVSLLNLLD